MEYAVAMLAWILGTVFGALSVASVERGERTEKARTYSRLVGAFYLKKAGIYSYLMVAFYLLAFLTIAVAEIVSWLLWAMGLK